MKQKKFNLLQYYIVLSFITMLLYGVFFWINNIEVHNKYLLKNGEEINLSSYHELMNHYRKIISDPKYIGKQYSAEVWEKAISDSTLPDNIKLSVIAGTKKIIYVKESQANRSSKSGISTKQLERVIATQKVLTVRYQNSFSTSRKGERNERKEAEMIDTLVPIVDHQKNVPLIIVLSIDASKLTIQNMERSLVFDTFLGLLILLIVLSIFVAKAQTIIDKETTSIKKDSYLRTVKALVNAIEARDPYTLGHSTHVANLVLLLYRHLPKEYQKNLDVQKLEFAGLLHDVGKIGVPESVLGKTGPLNSEEWELMKRHPEIGVQILKPVTDLAELQVWIYHHHERLDGKGYPLGLQKEDIPFVSRLIAIADTYSALTTDRPYRKGKNHNEAIAVMNSVSGIQLDDFLFQIFRGIDFSEFQKTK